MQTLIVGRDITGGTLGNARFAELGAAPGSYVLDR